MIAAEKLVEPDFELPVNDCEPDEKTADPHPSRTGHADPRDIFITLPGGRQLAARDYGRPEDPAVFYFHGFPGSRLEPGFFRFRNIRVIAVDRPGYGESHPNPGRKLLDWPKDIEALADHLGLERFGIVGMSGGGPYATAATYALHERVIALTLIAPLGPPEAPGMNHPRIRLLRNVGSRALTRSFLFHIMRRGILAATDDEKVARRRRRLAKGNPDAKALDLDFSSHLMSAFREALRHSANGLATDARIYGERWPFALEDIGVPVILWHGEDDHVVPASISRYYAARIPDTRVHMLPNESHVSIAKNHMDNIAETMALAVRRF